MRRFVSLAILIFFAVPFGISIAGCSHSSPPVYCNGADTGPVVGQVASITLSPNLATYGESLNYGQIGQGLSATSVDCKNNNVSVKAYTYATSNMAIADINPSTGSVCAGTWNRNTGGGVPDFTTCTPPPTPPSTYLAYVTASAGGATSNAIPVFVHPIATSVIIGDPTPETTTTMNYAITGYTIGATTTTFNTSAAPPPANAVATLSGFAISTFLNTQVVTVTASGPNSFTVANTFGETAGSLVTESGTATSTTVACVPTNDPSSNCCPYQPTAPGNPALYDGTSCISQGQTAQLAARVYDNNGSTPADNITCEVGNLNFTAESAPSVVTIDENGVATANLPGSTTITTTISETGSASTSGFFSTCPAANISLTASGKTGSPIGVNLNNVQPLTAVVTDTNGNLLTGLSLEFESTDPRVIPTSGNSVEPVFPGTATITAVCQPGTCNPASYSQIGLQGNGTPLTSTPVEITAAGTSSTVLYVGSTQSQYIYPMDFTTNQPGTLVKLPYVPNSMVITNDGSEIYLGSAEGLMSVSTANNAVGTTNTNVMGPVLSVSPNDSTLVVDNTESQTVDLISSAGAIEATYGGVGTHAQWSPDSNTVYITTTTDQVLVHNVFTGWTANLTDEPYNDVAVAVPAVGAYFGGTKYTEGLTYCPDSTVNLATPPATSTVTNTFYPVADTEAAVSDRVAATTDGNHILGATAITTPATLNDLTFTGNGLNATAPCSATTPTKFSSAVAAHPLTGIDATAITGVDPATNSAIAFITYTGSSTNPAGPQLPFYLPATGAVDSLTLGNGATTLAAPVQGVFSSDNLTFYAGTGGTDGTSADDDVHVIGLTYPSSGAPTAAETGILSPNLPSSTGTGYAPVNLMVQRPKKSTS